MTVTAQAILSFLTALCALGTAFNGIAASRYAKQAQAAAARAEAALAQAQAERRASTEETP